MAEMNQMFQTKMQAMQDEIASLKAKNAAAPVAAAPAPAGTAAPGAEAPGEWAKKISLGGQVTFRGYNLQNVWDFNDATDGDNRDLFRLKGSLWADYKATDDVTARIQLTDQTWGEGVTYDQSSLSSTDSAMDNNSNKVFLDNAYVNVKNLLGLPIEGTFGRQNVIYGSGFVILDGQSQFSSSSIYFDGVKLRWNVTDNFMVDGLYLKDQENNTSNNVIAGTTATSKGHGDDITLSGLYMTNKKCAFTSMQEELYVLNRSDEWLKKNIWMYGLRLSNKLENGLDFSAEAAIQRGDAGFNQFNPTENMGQDAWGTKLDVGYTFKDVTTTPRLYANYSFMSGDDQNSEHDSEQWDVFYGGWPQFGDLLAWKYLNLRKNNTENVNSLNKVYNSYDSYSAVAGEAIYSNLQLASFGASAKFTPQLSGNLSYTWLNFDETDPGVSDDFGDLYQATLTYQYNKQLSFSLYGALLAPGEAFTDHPTDPNMDDNATEVYWETMYKF